MTTALVSAPGHDRSEAGTFLLAGIVLATLTEAIASTVLSLGRGDIIGDTYATPDEFAWLDISYTSLKLMAFLAALGHDVEVRVKSTRKRHGRVSIVVAA